MIVHRQTFTVKLGQRDAAMELLNTGGTHVEPTPTFRVYGNSVGPHDTVVLEIEFENLADYERFWNAWRAAPESAAVFEKWYQLIEPGGTSEIWDLL